MFLKDGFILLVVPLVRLPEFVYFLINPAGILLADDATKFSFVYHIITIHGAKIGNISETCKHLGKFFRVGGFGRENGVGVWQILQF